MLLSLTSHIYYNKKVKWTVSIFKYLQDRSNWEHNNTSKSSKFVDVGTIESMFKTSYWSSLVTNVTLVLPFRVSEILELLYAKSHFFAHHPYFGVNFEVFTLEKVPDVESAKSKDPRLTNREIIFKEFQPMWSRYLNAMDRRTDRETTLP